MKKLRFIFIALLVMAWVVPAFAADIGLSKITFDWPVPASPDIYHSGDTVKYRMTVVNLSPTDIIQVDSVVDTLPDGTKVNLTTPAWGYTLAPGASQQYTLNWVVPTPCIPGNIVNEIKVSGVQFSTFPDEFTASVTKSSNVVCPCVEVDKTVDPLISKAGDMVTYTITVTNCGGPDIGPGEVLDSILGALPEFVQTLATGESETHMYDYWIPQGAPDPLVNEVAANYIDQYGYPVSDNDSAEVDLLHPDFTITMDCLTDPCEPGASALFKVTIVNTGDVALNITTDLPELPFVSNLQPGATFVKDDISKLCEDDGVTLGITAQATLPAMYNLDNVIGPYQAEETCGVAGGATRTIGFWKTHCQYTEHVFVEHCGSFMDLGWIQITTIEDALGALWANPGGKISRLCRARLIATRQAVAALLNNCLDNGAPLPIEPADIASILAGSNRNNILWLAELLDDYNNSGSDVAIIDNDGFMFSNATPRECKAIANFNAVACSAKLRK